MDAVFKTDIAVFNYRVAGVWMIDGHVLVHKNKHDDHWALPGGRVQLMEQSTTALQREFQEELQLDVQVTRLLWTTENFFHYEGRSFHEIAFYYQVAAHIDGGITTEEFSGTEEDKHLIYKWIPIATLAEIPLRPEFLINGLKTLPLHTEHMII